MENDYILSIPADRPAALTLVLVAAVAGAGTLAALAGAAGVIVFSFQGDGVAAAASLVVCTIGGCMSLAWPYFAKLLKLRKERHLHYLALSADELVYRRCEEKQVVRLRKITGIRTHLEHHPAGDYPGSDWYYRVYYRDASGRGQHLDISAWEFTRARVRWSDLAELLKRKIEEIGEKDVGEAQGGS
jgi:hypothetical protein